MSVSSSGGPIAIGGLVISSVAAPLRLAQPDADRVQGQLKWLFAAVDNLLIIHHKFINDGVLDTSQPVIAPIPPEAERIPEANNLLLTTPAKVASGLYTLTELLSDYWQIDLEGRLQDISSHLDSLTTLQQREAGYGAAGEHDAQLQNEIKLLQLSILDATSSIAEIISEAYGVRLTAPQQLRGYLSDQQPGDAPIGIGGRVTSTLLADLDLDPAEQDLITGELQWLFAAIEHFLTVYQQFETTGVIDHTTTVARPVPSEAELTNPAADNTLLKTPQKAATGIFTLAELIPDWQLEIDSRLQDLSIQLENLSTFLAEKTALGQASQADVKLKTNITNTQASLIDLVNSLAAVIDQAYGIRVTSPQLLKAYLDG
ncbi:MAG: hypothetical protein R3264_10940 [Anaerolineae bacterium]|nr:hypothetical protein [Anaerolineae bacterium]